MKAPPTKKKQNKGVVAKKKLSKDVISLPPIVSEALARIPPHELTALAKLSPGSLSRALERAAATGGGLAKSPEVIPEIRRPVGCA